MISWNPFALLFQRQNAGSQLELLTPADEQRQQLFSALKNLPCTCVRGKKIAASTIRLAHK
jgi:hypothetical protein